MVNKGTMIFMLVLLVLVAGALGKFHSHVPGFVDGH
jgi:hypothetical protein